MVSNEKFLHEGITVECRQAWGRAKPVVNILSTFQKVRNQKSVLEINGNERKKDPQNGCLPENDVFCSRKMF